MDWSSLECDPGTVERGFVDVATLPTGGNERLPVVIVEGEADGPELWITATIHGDEANGLAVAHDLLADDLAETIDGRIVCLPSLNPAGLRRNSRAPYYGSGDPNRSFPTDDEIDDPEDIQTLIYRQVYEAFEGSADALLDLHTASLGAIPFNFRHPVLYGEERTEAEARELAAEVTRLMEAFGLPIVNESPDYSEDDLHRTTTGAAINLAGIPAMTVELGHHTVLQEDVIAAGVAGCYRVMEAIGLIDGVPPDVEEAEPGYEPPVDYPVKQTDGPRTDTAGIVRERVRPGESVNAGEVIAEIRDIHGVRKAVVDAEEDGYVLSLTQGAAVYENDEIVSQVVRDDREMIQPREDDG